MDAQLWKRVDDLLQSVIQLPEDQRQVYLREACRDNLELCREVESLLRAHKESDGFLESPIAQMNAGLQGELLERLFEPRFTDQPRSLIGQTVSHYRILGLLGSGGMSVVYRAEDIKLGRQVAIKFLPGEVAGDDPAFDRLEREARAASSLEHGNICTIYEFGEHLGQPFLVMQLLEGKTLREWIEDATDKSTAAHVERSVELAIQIAQGLDAAHAMGIIHRDIKPANVLVTQRGEVKILDFGLAKLLEDRIGIEPPPGQVALTATSQAAPDLTLTGMRMGTAYYMSPEQVRGETLDARTDLFSLGSVLYEMTTGRRAFPGDSRQGIHSSILHDQPTPPRLLNGSIPVELERILQKAMEKDRTRRYRSAVELRSDLDSLRKRLRPASHLRLWLAIGVILLAGLAVTTVVVWKQARHASPVVGENATALIKRRKAVAVLEFRNQSGKAEEQWLSTALAEMIRSELSAGQQLRVIPGESIAHMRRDLGLLTPADYGRETLHRIATHLDSDWIVQGAYLNLPGGEMRVDVTVQDANSGEVIGSAIEKGKQPEADSLVTRAAVRLREQLGLAVIPDDQQHSTHLALPTQPDAARSYSEGLSRLRVFDALGARDLAARAVALDPSHAMSHVLLADSLSMLGYAIKAQAEAKKAYELSNTLPRENQLLVEARYRELGHAYAAAIEIYRTLWSFFQDNLDYGLKLADAQDEASLAKDAMATVARMRKLPAPASNDPQIDQVEAEASKQLGDAKRCLKAATTAAEKARSAGSRMLEARARNSQSWALNRLGETQKAMEAISESRRLAKAAGNPLAEAAALNGAGAILYSSGDLAGARRQFEDGLKVALQLGSLTLTSAAKNNLGSVLYEQGKLAEARRYYEESLEIERVLDNKEGMALSFENIGNVLENQGDLEAAGTMQEEALQEFRQTEDRQGEADILVNLGATLEDRGDLLNAQERFQEAVAKHRQIVDRHGEAVALSDLAEVLIAQDRLPEARAATVQAIALERELKDEDGASGSQIQLAKIEVLQGHAAEAEKVVRAETDRFEKTKDSDDGCQFHATLARALLQQDKVKEAREATSAGFTRCEQSQDKELRLQFEIVDAVVKFRVGSKREALRLLEKVHIDAVHSGFVSDQLESELYRGEAEIEAGAAAQGRSRLDALMKRAERQHYNLIARKAKLALAGAPLAL